jgi:putative ABC transport system permease protein
VGTIAATQAAIEVGDRFPLFRTPYGGIDEYEVVGIFNSRVQWENLGTIIDARIVQEQLAAGDAFAFVLIYTAPGTSGEQLDRIRDAIEEAVPRLTAKRADEVDEHYDSQLQYIDHFIAIISFIAVVIGVLGVANTMMMSVTERSREIGTLRAVGWSRARVVRMIAGESLLIAILGGLLGIGLGVAGSEFTIKVLFDEAALQASYEAATMVKGMLVAISVGLIGAVYPAMRAASLRPAEALRYE